MGPRRTAMLLMLAGSQACAQPATQPAPAAQPRPAIASGKHIFLPPPVQWENDLLSNRPALQLSRTDFANLAGGLAFGMSATEVNAKLPDPYPGMSWNALTLANDYPGEVRYFGVPLSAAGPLRMDLTACAGAEQEYEVAAGPDGLFRLSYRLAPDNTCTDTNEAAQQIFGRYVPLGRSVARSARYRTGKTEVVDVTDPLAGYLIPIRWRQGL